MTFTKFRRLMNYFRELFKDNEEAEDNLRELLDIVRQQGYNEGFADGEDKKEESEDSGAGCG